MIYDQLSHLDTYTALPGMAEVKAFLAGKDLAGLPLGRTELANGVFCTVSVSDARAEGAYECHHRYADVQIVLDGTEIINCAPTDTFPPCADFSEEKDIGFLEGRGACSVPLLLVPGMFAVFYPQDAHEPLIRVRHDKIKKIVFKLPV